MGLINSQNLVWPVGFGILALVVYGFFGGTRLRRNGIPLRKPPNTLPLVGNGIVFLQARQKLFSWFVKCDRQYGYETLQISVPTLPPGVIISDPRNLEYVFKNEGIFAKGNFVKGRSLDLFGHGIINADGDLWKVQRKAGLNFLNTANLRVLTDVALPRFLSQGVRTLEASCDGRIIDLQAFFHECTTQVMGKMAYNMEMHADDAFSVAFDYASGATAERFQNPLWPVTEVFFGAKFRRSIAVVKSFGREIVASAVRDRTASKANEVGESKLDQISGSLIQSFLDSIGDEQMVADAALNYLSAGRDTTAQALTWTFYLLMKHRHIVTKIRKEIHDLLSSTDITTAAPNPTLFTPTSLPYTHAVFSESIRLYPPVPFEIKQAIQATTLPDGTFLPQHSVVLWCPWSMNRSHHTWGPDADAFRPDRWVVEGKVVQKSASEFPVFNGGPRTCLGKKMAEVMAVQVIATLVWGFEFMESGPGERVSKSSLTLPMEGGLPCLVRKRNVSVE